MNILGVGPLEFFLIIVLMLVVLGPRNMVETGRKIGAFIRKIVRSPMWREMMQTQQQIRDIPNTIIRDANLEETLQELKTLPQDVQKEVDISREVAEINKIPTEIATEVDSQHKDALHQPASPVKPGAVDPVEIPKPGPLPAPEESAPEQPASSAATESTPSAEDTLPQQPSTPPADPPKKRGRPRKIESTPAPAEPAPEPQPIEQPAAEPASRPRGRPRKTAPPAEATQSTSD